MTSERRFCSLCKSANPACHGVSVVYMLCICLSESVYVCDYLVDSWTSVFELNSRRRSVGVIFLFHFVISNFPVPPGGVTFKIIS